jgi:DNA-directed RNA polymerase specialized sigma24 family protein
MGTWGTGLNLRGESMDTTGSVTRLLRDLQAGDEQAVGPLWERYFQRLAAAAKARLGDARWGAGDHEDVALSAFHSFCQRLEHGRLPDLDGRQELWRVLVVITRRKAISWLRHETAVKRGGGKIRSQSLLENIVSAEPSPDFVAEFLEDVDRLLNLLHREDATLCLIAKRKLEGFSNAEIAAELSLTPRSIQRKVERVRILWSADADNRGDSPPGDSSEGVATEGTDG